MRQNPDDLNALRLKGNVLDLGASDEEADFDHEQRAKMLEMALECYERILALAPHNALALIDLADFWKNQDRYDESLGYYD